MAKPKAPKDMERPQRRADDLVPGFLLCPVPGTITASRGLPGERHQSRVRALRCAVQS
jgi:hypothetical protein